MRKFNLLAAIAALSLTGGAAVAEEKAVKPAKERKICKGQAGSTSRIAKKRICKTRAEWAETANQEDLEDAESRLRGMSRGNR
ncbi:MAG TPA: hypothetical protein VE891_15810 [Allosphingosinicella sp.]|nr:hypothetical protein [Allosphingosinicella sp.]